MSKFLFVLLLSTSSCYSFAATTNTINTMPSYTHADCGYTIFYPKDSQSKPITEKAIAAKYSLDPLQYVHDLQAIKQFANPPKNALAFSKIKINDTCILEIDLAKKQQQTNLDGKYLFVLQIDNVPKEWPVPAIYPNGQKIELVTLNNKNYAKVNTRDAGMCHQIDNTYYFLKSGNKYYVLNFVLTSHCFGIKDTDKKQFNKKLEIADFDKIAANFLIK